MKKFMAMLAAFLMLLSFAACSAKDCEGCGKEGEGTNEVTVDGETGYLCDDCKALVDLAGSLGGLAE
ncbi:MAG: hypothetical protein IJO09_07125 [Oscillospiraceae bacterium]|nr:hypothetical protein [Oscillospiraceae bacterium]